MLSCLALFSLLCAAVSLVGCHGGDQPSPNHYNFDHVRFVDHDSNSGNFLFRGGSPINSDHKFAYDNLVDKFEEQAEKAGHKFPKDFFFVDLCLLTEGLSDPVVNTENEFFKENSKLGKFNYWPMHGVSQTTVHNGCKQLGISSSQCPSDQPKDFSHDVAKKLALSWPKWANSYGLDEKMAQTNKWLKTKQSKPWVMYGHCICGCDRTGEFFASYMMQFQNKTFTEAMKYDETIPKRHIGYSHQVAAEWRCLYLHYTTGFPKYSSDCKNCKDFRCSNHASASDPIVV